jgi:hypothetical protein
VTASFGGVAPCRLENVCVLDAVELSVWSFTRNPKFEPAYIPCTWLVTVKDCDPVATDAAVIAVALTVGWFVQVTPVSVQVVGTGVTPRVRPVTPELTAKVSTAAVTVQCAGVVGRVKVTSVRWFAEVAEDTDKVVDVPVFVVGVAWATVLSAVAFTVVVPGVAQKPAAAAKVEDGFTDTVL